MKETWIIAVHYFERMARKPLLVLFMLAIPVTLLLAEFAAFGRPQATSAAASIPLKLLVTAQTPTGDQFVRCISEQPGHPLSVERIDHSPALVQDSDLVTISGASPVKVSLRGASADPASSLLESNILRLCASESSPVISPDYSLVIERAASASSSTTIGSHNFLARFFPGLALFGALFLAQAMASLIWRDQELSVNKRLLNSPIHPSSLVLGPLVFLTAGATFSLLLILGLCAFATNPIAVTTPSFWALTVGFGLCAAGLQMTVGLLAGSQRAAHAMSSSTNMMLAFFGGGFVPLSIYPPLLRALAYCLPNGAAQAGLSQVLENATVPYDLFGHVTTVWVWATVLVLIAVILQVRRMRA